jgi:hypothetical protein
MPSLLLVEEFEDVGMTSGLAEGELDALRAVADWIKTFVARPHKDLGRAGPVCPFVPGALERTNLWLAPEQIRDRGVSHVVQLMNGYKNLFLATQPTASEEAVYKAFVVVFTDLSTGRARDLFDAFLADRGVPTYVEDGLVLGAFYETNGATAIYNGNFRPFRSPVPFLLMRNTVISDWKFFLDNEEWFKAWSRRFGESAVDALAKELRRLPWRAEGEHSRATGELMPLHRRCL